MIDLSKLKGPDGTAVVCLALLLNSKEGKNARATKGAPGQSRTITTALIASSLASGFQYLGEQLVGKTLLDLVPDPVAEKLRSYFALGSPFTVGNWQSCDRIEAIIRLNRPIIVQGDNMTATAILEEIRSLVIDLPLEERLQLIREIASIGLAGEPSTKIPSPQKAGNQHKQQLIIEQNQWFARPVHERQQYTGQYVAVYQGKVVDSDVDQRQLYLRVRTHFKHKPVLLISADLTQTPVYTIHSPQVSR